MKLKFLAGILAAAMICPIACAYADDVPYDISYSYSKSKLSISGQLDTADKFVSLQILKKGKEFNSSTAVGDVVYIKQIPLNDGMFSFDAGFDFANTVCSKDGTSSEACAKGEYSARLATEGNKDTYDFEVYITSKRDLEDVYSRLKAAADSENTTEFLSILNGEREALNLGFALTDGKALGDDAANYMKHVKANTLSADNESANIQSFKKLMTANVLNNSTLENIDEVINELYDADDSFISDYKALVKTIAVQKYLTQKMYKQDIKTETGFDDAIKTAYMLASVRYSDGAAGIAEALNSYGSAIGLTGTIDEAVCGELSGKDYADGDALKEAYSKLDKDTGKSNGGNKRPTSSGGGGGGAFGGISEMDKIEKPENEIISMQFEDLDGVMWASEAILALADKGIINGKSEGQFKPRDMVTREEFAKILVLAMNLGDEKYEKNVFVDVDENQWYCDYVNIAAVKEIVRGVGDNRFGVGEVISRQDMATMLYNALKSLSVDMNTEGLKFEDSNQIADYAKAPVAALVNLGAVNGVSETEFAPAGNATRAEAAKMVYGVIDLLQ